MAQTSPLLRYRPAVLAVTGVAAAYGIYLVYSTVAVSSTGSSLRRSNAVHRPRRELEMTVTPPEADNAPLGLLQVSRDGRNFTRNLAATQALPTKDELRSAVGQVSESDMQQLEALAVRSILDACLEARSDIQRARLIRLGLEGIPEALERRQHDEVRQRSEQIIARLPGLDKANMNLTIERFLVTLMSTDHSGLEDIASEIMETEDLDGAPKEPSQPLKGLLYYIAEEDARRKAYEHRGIHCEECGEGPIRGVRYHCLNCPDYDLCSTCEMQTTHIKTHVMAKIKIPLPILSQPTKTQPLWYPGDPRKVHPSLNANIRKRLAAETGFEEPKIDALYDQFTCVANVPWSQDPIKIHAAIDRRAFNKALTSENWVNRFAPNTVHDRIFAFYDTDRDGRIGFEEFVSGVAYLRGPRRYESLRPALRGYDFDGDGFVCRADFVRMFKAKYAIQKQIVSDMVEAHEDDQTYAAMEVLRSSQPISSVFNQEEIPHGEEMPRHGKQMDRFGDMQPLDGTKTLLDDSGQPIFQGASSDISSPSIADPRHQLLRLEEILYGSCEEHNTWSEAQQESIEQRDYTIGSETGAAAIEKYSDSRADDRVHYDAQGWDPLLVAIEEGFNQMLDPLFAAREAEEREIESTRSQRDRWRTQIDEVEEDKRIFQEELKQAAMIDPLMATAMKSLGAIKVERKLEEDSEISFRGRFVATDSKSLEEREAEIAQRPLQELLAATGYSTIEPDAPSGEEADSSIRDKDAVNTEQGEYRATDPTLPQNRPNALNTSAATALDLPVKSDHAAPTIQAELPQIPPLKRRLEYFATLDHAESAANARGGPGRLTFEEVEAIVDANTTPGLRGLMISWLEWASF